MPTKSQIQNFWTNCVSFYFDGVNFTHKYNPLEEVHHCKINIWGLWSEGLSRTGKGKKKGTGGKFASFFIGISHKKSLVTCILLGILGSSIVKVLQKQSRGLSRGI